MRYSIQDQRIEILHPQLLRRMPGFKRDYGPDNPLPDPFVGFSQIELKAEGLDFEGDTSPLAAKFVTGGFAILIWTLDTSLPGWRFSTKKVEPERMIQFQNCALCEAKVTTTNGFIFRYRFRKVCANCAAEATYLIKWRDPKGEIEI